MNSNETQHEQVKLQFYPENLEVSKVCSLLNEDLCFKIDDVHSLKEIQKLVSNKEDFIGILNSLASEGEIKLRLSEGEGSINLKDELTLYHLLNVPNKMSKDQLCEMLGVKEGDFKRLYKQSIYWVMVSENPEFNSTAEQKLKQIKFDDSNLRYDTSNSKNIKRQIMKKIQHLTYIKETDDLKASTLSSSGPRKESFTRGDKLSTNSNQNSTEAFSWRKKSDMSSTSKDDNQLNIGKSSNTKIVSSFNPSNTKFARRERFNSDPYDKSNAKTSVFNSNYDEMGINYPEVVIDPKLVKYPLTVTYKYSMRDLFEFYNKNKEKLSRTNTAFKTLIPEVCNENTKDLSSSFVSSGFRKNSYEAKSNVKANFEVKTSLLTQPEKIVIPKNNPLGDISSMNSLSINK